MAAGERGNAHLTLVLGLAVVSAFLTWLGSATATSVARHHAQSVADLAALGAASGGEPAAREIVEGNRGQLVEVTLSGEVVRVAVRVAGHAASAHAILGP
jgi:hypothetical protein